MLSDKQTDLVRLWEVGMAPVWGGRGGRGGGLVGGEKGGGVGCMSCMAGVSRPLVIYAQRRCSGSVREVDWPSV